MPPKPGLCFAQAMTVQRQIQLFNWTFIVLYVFTNLILCFVKHVLDAVASQQSTVRPVRKKDRGVRV